MTANSTALRIAQYEDKDFDLYAYDVPTDENGAEGAWTRMDLTGTTLTFQVKDAAGNTLITKTSTTPAEITINADQVTLATKGTAILSLVRADTSSMVVGTVYYYDLWVLTSAGKWRRLIKKSLFHVEDGVYEPAP